jgi:peptidoglycan/LPS O-acetylase OafA/YrhL
VPALLEFCRGAAILGVVGVHAVHGWFGWQGVHVFVVAGGFALAWGALARDESPDWRAWARRRVARILPTYWATALAGFAVVWLATAAADGEAEDAVRAPLRQLALDLALLRDLDWRAAFGEPNASLWYVPLLAGFYAAFPWLYGRMRAAEGDAALARVVAVACAVELAWRAAAVFLLDGKPVGYGHGFLPRVGTVPADLARVADDFPFQKWAPFCLAPARIGEFALGMAAAVRLARVGPAAERALLGRRAAAAGAAAWLAGNAALQWRAGWVVADLLIAGGLTVLVLAAAARLAPRRGRTWRLGTWLGAWAYYLFLAHLLVGYVVAQAIALAPPSSLVLVPAVPAAVGGLVLACRALRALDRSALPARVGRALVRQP